MPALYQRVQLHLLVEIAVVDVAWKEGAGRSERTITTPLLNPDRTQPEDPPAVPLYRDVIPAHKPVDRVWVEGVGQDLHVALELPFALRARERCGSIKLWRLMGASGPLVPGAT